jgi:low temperature requirement protein LtrA
MALGVKPGTWPLRRRAEDDACDPVELLVDITFVLALSQAGGLIRLEPGAIGVAQALAALAVVVRLWQGSVSAVSCVDVAAGPMRLLQIAQTGLFLALAVCLPEAFTSRPGGLNGPVLFAAAVTAAALCMSAQWIIVCAGVRRFIPNTTAMVAGYVMLAVLVWCAVGAHGYAKPGLMLIGYLATVVLSSLASLPIARWAKVGLVEGWRIRGVRAYAERYSASYVVACCLSLELLEQAGQAAAITPAMLSVVLSALVIAYLLYQIYAPLAEPGRRAMDPVASTLSLGRKLSLAIIGYVLAYVVIYCGLVVSSSVMRTLLSDMAVAGSGRLGPAVSTGEVAELYGGIAACLLGQALFSYLSSWRPDWLRMGAALMLVAAIPLMTGRPAPVLLVSLTGLCAGVLAADRRARRGASPALTGLGRIGRWRAWRPVVRFAGTDHEVSGFELLFDLMVAFAFSQTDVLVLFENTASGAVRALLVLAMIWGCWLTYAWAANTADANAGTLRLLHGCALAGMVFLGMALPRAFDEYGFNTRVQVFLAAYLVIRVSSAFALRLVLGARAGRRPRLVAMASLCTAALLAASTVAPAADRMPLWLLALGSEAGAAIAFTRRWAVNAPGHLAGRYAFIVIIGLDMSLGGMGRQMAGQPIGARQLTLITLALVSSTVMWWLYFDTLSRYAERAVHAMHLARPLRPGSVRRRHAHVTTAQVHYNLLHLMALSGMVSYAFGLRAIAQALGEPHTSAWGPDLQPISAIALCAGLALYAVTISVMWMLLRRKPRGMPIAVAAVCVALTPSLTGKPDLPALAILTAVGLALLFGEILGPRSRRERAAVRADLAWGRETPLLLTNIVSGKGNGP